MSKADIILYGAGTTGRVIARDLNAKGVAVYFADNDTSKHTTLMEGIKVISPLEAKELYPDATWICSVVRPERADILEHIQAMAVKTAAMWDYVPKRYNLPPTSAKSHVCALLHDQQSVTFWADQIDFRTNPEDYCQIPQSDIDNIYFEDFIIPRDDEHYVDCGAADGDTVKEFMKRWENWSLITAFEPDVENYAKLRELTNEFTEFHWAAVTDYLGRAAFMNTGDYSAHLGEVKGSSGAPGVVRCVKLDEALRIPPTFIKMDIEGSELEAIWGARRIIKEHSPVLAICAYHEAEHLWEIPLLIHAIQPEYKFFLRRYAESTFELVWYAVPPERVKGE